MENVMERKDGNFVIDVLKGCLIALSISLISVLVFAMAIKFLPITHSAIKPVNQVIKAISILVGCFTVLKNKKSMGLFKGIVIGALFTFVAFVVFSLLDGGFEFSQTLINDVIFGGVIGAVCGVVAMK